MNTPKRNKLLQILAWLSIIPILIVVFLLNILVGVDTRDIEYAPPPQSVATAPESPPAPSPPDEDIAPADSVEPDSDADVAATVTPLDAPPASAESLESLLDHVMTGTQRERIDAANKMLDSFDAFDYPSKERFWESTRPHHAAIMAAFNEVLVERVKEGEETYDITYLMAWSPAQDETTLEMLTWAAKHHPDPVNRRFSAFFVVRIAPGSEYTRDIIASFQKDPPSPRNRLEVMDFRMQVMLSRIESAF